MIEGAIINRIHPGIYATPLIANLAATWFMTGLIWFVQIVHYAQFDGVGEAGFCAYHRRHTRATTWVVGPPMLIEAVTSLWLVWDRPAAMSLPLAVLGVILLAVIWASTALLQVPAHEKLAAGFTPGQAKWLCRTNWIRTSCWTARGVLMAYVLSRMIH